MNVILWMKSATFTVARIVHLWFLHKPLRLINEYFCIFLTCSNRSLCISCRALTIDFFCASFFDIWFLSFQQIQVYLEEGVVSESLVCCSFTRSIDFIWKPSICFSGSAADLSVEYVHQVPVMNVSECKTENMSVKCSATLHSATLRDGHYSTGLPKRIIIKAVKEISSSQPWCWNNGGRSWNAAAQTSLFFSEIWLCQWHDWNNHFPPPQWDESFVRCWIVLFFFFFLIWRGKFVW